jgi:hypothetical protein
VPAAKRDGAGTLTLYAAWRGGRWRATSNRDLQNRPQFVERDTGLTKDGLERTLFDHPMSGNRHSGREQGRMPEYDVAAAVMMMYNESKLAEGFDDLRARELGHV